MTNDKVAKCWAEGKPAQGSNFRTDGVYVWSYFTVIAYKDTDGVPVITTKKYSVSTSRHTTYCLRAATNARRETF